MSNKRKLWQIFGPVICAFILLFVVFIIPWNRKVSDGVLFKASVSQSQNVFKGENIKRAAFEKEYVPFYGSSELSRMDPLHPSVLAYKYHRSYQPFLLGGPGSQSLTHFMNLQETKKQLAGKKAVFIISPQWFVKEGQDPAAFGMYFSQLQAIDWILSAKDSVATRYAAKRLLKMPSATSSESTKAALKDLADGKKISNWQRSWLQMRQRTLSNQDDFFTTFDMKNNIPKLQSGAHKLPGTYAYDNLRQFANNQGAQGTTNNSFNISNNFFKKRLLKNGLKGLKDSQKNFDYTRSPEFGDFELVLNEFAQEHVNVLFVIPPVNSKWAKYTGLSEKMYQRSVNKIKAQLLTQGFTHVADLSKDGGKEYFMEDTIHLGWNGWLTMDKYVQSFMKLKNTPINYQLNNYYFSEAWAKKPDAKISKSVEEKAAEINRMQNLMNQQGLQGTVTEVKNNKVRVSYATGWANKKKNLVNTEKTSYLIDSVQKAMTATMVMRQVEKGNLKLTDKLAKFYPNIDQANRITIQQLLEMTSGLTTPNKAPLGSPKFENDQAGIEYDIDHLISFKDNLYGKRYYSSINYVLLSGILEKVTHQSYESLFNETFVKKLKLENTAFIWNKKSKLQKVHLAQSYRYANKNKTSEVPITLNLNELHGELGAGSVVMSTSDLYKTEKAITDGTLLSKNSMKILFRGKAPAYYGGGFYNNPAGFRAANGAGVGYHAFVRISNNGKNAVIIQTNHPIKSFKQTKVQMDKLISELIK
ncbi:D-alanyl-lipoteichoic acid biosynthesis protein DltD [Lactobacillus sp. PV037]|uniref:D-alanyl-lipoteichoic acid biosynthesis protein DltD n=1 Tax=Lactobacillus sp. PV037 TaxID=2594496 RepID=UPI002240CC87|nr:D-alanyl-lipoteichoic acid biosynthesis protein DltD [Lactobacillus sp. PV037]QNQ84402.1 D-alanyl-lipoteichoic acid biosynthesis protein DltD [Lactobacillus sp. PV037]